MKTFTNLAHRAFKKCASLSTSNRNRYYLFTIIMLLTLGIGSAWAESTDTYDFKTDGITKKSGPNSGNMTSSSQDVVFVSKTGNTTDSWTIEFIGDTYYGYGKNNGVQFGSKNYPPKGNLISKSYDNVSQVELITTTTSTDVNMSVKVGAVSFGEKVLTSGNSISQVFSGTATTGAITVSLAGSSKNNIKIEKIIITYGVSSGGGSDPDEPTCTAITPTLTYSATSLVQGATATATLEGNTGSGEVTYTTSDDKIATVDANGTVTAVGAGTAKITATVAATGEYCEGKATATITVTPLISCSEVYNLADDATFALKKFVVTYANGKYTYIKDGTGYGLIFNNAGAYGLKAGDQVAAAELAGKKDTYNGLVEIIPTSVFADLEITSGTAPDPEVMNALPVKADMNKYVKFEDVTFASTAFSSKKVTGKINAGNITFYDQFATNETFNTSKKYHVIGAVSIYNSTIQVNFISAEEVAEPTLNVKITDADFGKIAIDGKAERTLTLNGSLLTNAVSLAIEGEGAEHFKLASNSVTPTEGTITDAKIKITYKPTAEGTHTATLKITSDDVEEQTITLQGQAVQQHIVHFFVNGDEQTDLAKKVLSGNTLEEIPEATSCDQINYPTFAGWASAAIDGTTDVKPTMLDLSTPVTNDCNYYAVFAKGTTSSGTANTSYELVLLPSHFITDYKERSFKATANEVDGEGTLEVSLTSAGVMKSTDASKGNPIQFRKKSSSTSPGTIYNTTDLEQINSISYADGTNNIASTIIGTSQQPTEQEDGKGFFMITNGTSVSYIPSITINFTKASVSEITTYEYITSCAAVVPTCEITYDFAGGEGECTTDIVEKDTEYTLCATAPTKTGHTFLNWKDQHGTEYAAGATITSVTEDLTLTAQWQVNSYEVTWMSLGSKLSSSKVNYNIQPTKPSTNPTYLCGTDKEFVGWSTQEIDGAGVPANLYTDVFPVVTEAITYHAVFASINSSAESTTHTLTPNNSWSGYAEGTITDNKGYTWSYCAAGTKTDGVYSLNLRNKDTETSYIGSPLFTANVKNIKATIVNGSASKARKVYVCSAPTLEPTTGDLGITEVAGGHSGELSLAFEGTISQFYLQVSDALQFQSIKVEVGEAPYIDYVTSCEEVGSDMSNSTKVTPSVESGIFSVGNNKYVQFSTGNLQYEVGTNTWSFASEQYEVIGGEAYTGSNNTNYGMNVPGYTGKLDLFGWSCDGKYGVNPSNADADYTGAFADWGNLVDETGWYTLTKDEMNYILNRKKDGKKLWALATVCGMNGLILLPDNWNTSITLDYGYVPANFNYTKNQIDDATWQTLEDAGAVFLPEGGTRVGGHGNKEQGGGPDEFDAHRDYFHVDNVNEMGYYWLNTQDTRTEYLNCASFLILPGWSDNGTPNDESDDKAHAPQVWSREKRRGNSVRLVKEVTPNYTRDKQGAGVYGTVCYPENIVWCDGATLYEVAGKEGNKVIFDEVTTPEAGIPYIFIADQEVINFFCGTEYEGTAGKHNSLQGTFTQIDPAVDNILVGNYMLVNNIIKKCGINCGLYANRAYFVATELENMGTAPAAVQGRRRISLDVASENTTTGIDNITNGENTTIKVIENGQLIIIRNGEKYNAMGVKL